MFGISAASVSKAVAAAKAAFKASPVSVPLTFTVSPASVTKAVAAATAGFRASPVVIPVMFGQPSGTPGGGTAPAAGTGPSPVSGPSGGNAGAAAAGAAAARSFRGGWMGILGKPVSLFGGVFGTTALIGEIGLWHILVDWVIEFAAVLIPAGIALGAFGIAAFTTAKSIFTNFMNIRTIVAATGQSMGILHAGVSSVQAAVKPEVFQLWGDAITLATQKGGGFQSLAVATGHALDQLAARMTVAITASKGVGGIMATGAQDVAKLGTVLGNLGGTLGNVLRAVPGFAEVFLNLWVAVSKGAEVLTSLTVPALNVLLWAHGLILYAGLAVTGLMKIVPAVIAAGGAVADFALAAAANIAVFTADVVTAGSVVAGFEVISEALTPWGWIAIGVAALAGLILLVTSTKTATQALVASLQNTIMAAPTVSAGSVDILSAQLQVTKALTAANRTLAANPPPTLKRTSAGAFTFDPGYLKAADNVRTLTSAQAQLTAQQVLSNTRLASLTKTYGNQNTAMGLLNTAGVTEKQWQDKSAAGWANIQQQVMGTMLGYQQMHVTGGVLGNDLQVMNKQATDAFQAMTKLNGALDTWIKDVTGTQGTFDAFGQGLFTIAANEKAAGARMDGLNAASLTLNASFGAQVTATNAMIDTWRLAGVASNLQNKGIRDSIALLAPYAKGSREATAQLAALAEEAGYNGPASMKRLDAWLGNTHDALRNVKDIANQATIQEALLSSAMRGQGNVIANQLLGDLNNAILKYGGVKTAVQAYGKAIATQGAQSDAARTARLTLISDLITTGQRAHETTGQIAALITKITGIPLHRAVDIVVNATGSFRVTEGQIVTPGGGRINGGPGTPGAAKGMFVSQGRPGVDDQLIMAQRGEVIVPTPMVRAGAVDHLRGKIPGFAAGGLVGSFAGSPSGLGSFDLREYAATAALMEAADAAAAASAMKKAIAAAKASLLGGLVSGNAIVDFASQFVGKLPYVWGGTSLVTGADCSGFTEAVYAHFGIGIPRSSEAQFAFMQPSPDGPGRLVFFVSPAGGPPPGHVGISDGHGMMVNAAGTQFGTIVSSSGGNMGFGVPPNPAAGQRGRGPGPNPRIFDAGGWLPPGLTLVDNRTGKSEHLTRDSGSGGQGATLSDVAGLVSRLIRAVYDNAHMTADGVAEAIGAVAKTSAYRSAYSPR